MNNALMDMYADLAALVVQFKNASGAMETPTVYSLGNIPASIQTAHLPCRLLLPLGSGASGSNNVTIMAGGNIQAAWTITDFFLLDTVGQTDGLYVVAPVLLDYTARYTEAIGRLHKFIHGAKTLGMTVSASVAPGVYEYPSGSDVYFFGVKAEINIDEIF